MKLTSVEQKERISKLLNDVCIDLPVLLRQHLTQNDIAKKIGVDNTSFSQWITGVRLPTDKNITALAQGLAKYNQEWSDCIWDIMGFPRPIPSGMEAVAEWWNDATTDADSQKALLEWIHDDLAKKNGSVSKSPRQRKKSDLE